MARIADATAAEVKARPQGDAGSLREDRPGEALCDIVAACRMSKTKMPIDLDQWEKIKATIVDSRHHKEAKNTLGELSPLHFPIAFLKSSCASAPGST